MNLKKISCFILALSFSLNTAAETLLIPTLNTPHKEFARALDTLSDVSSLVDKYKRENPGALQVQELNQAFASAQASFLAAEAPEVIEEKYKRVLDFELQADWLTAQRKIFLLSYLRLLQTTPMTHTKRDFWKSQSLLYLDEMNIPQDLIPPPLIQELELHRDASSRLVISWPTEVKRQFSEVLIQGHPIKTENSRSLPTSTRQVRVTYLGFNLKPVTQILTLEQLNTFVPETEILVTGDCENALLKPGLPSNAKIYQPLSCPPPSDLKDVEQEKSLAAPPSTQPKEIHLENIAVETKSWKSERTWLLVGVGLVASAVLISQLNKPERSAKPRPTESHGF